MMRNNSGQIVHLLADALRRREEGEELSLNEVATQSDLHWVTVERYASLVEFVQRQFPRIEVRQAGKGKAVRIVTNPWLGRLEADQRLLLRLYLKKALASGSALELPDTAKPAAQKLASSGWIKIEADGRARLTKAGLLVASGLFESASNELDVEAGRSLPDEDGETDEQLQSILFRQSVLETLLRKLLQERQPMVLNWEPKGELVVPTSIHYCWRGHEMREETGDHGGRANPRVPANEVPAFAGSA